MRLEAQSFVRAELARYLAKDLPEVKVKVSIPNPRPVTFVLVRREGGSQQDPHRDSPGIGVFSYAPTEDQAAKLAKRVSQAMFALEFVNGVASVTEELLTSSPDPEANTPRWYGSYSLITYEIKE